MCLCPQDTYVYAYVRGRMHSHEHTDTDTHRNMQLHTQTRTQTRTQTWTQTQMQTRTRTRTPAYTDDTCIQVFALIDAGWFLDTPDQVCVSSIVVHVFTRVRSTHACLY